MHFLTNSTHSIHFLWFFSFPSTLPSVYHFVCTSAVPFIYPSIQWFHFWKFLSFSFAVSLFIIYHFNRKLKRKKNCQHIQLFFSFSNFFFKYFINKCLYSFVSKIREKVGKKYLYYYLRGKKYLYYYLRGCTCLNRIFFCSKIPTHSYI